MAGGDFRKVEEVNSLRPMGGDAGGSSPGYSGSRQRDKKGSGFAQALETERGRYSDTGVIAVKNTTYSARGIPSTVVIRMKDYTFQ